MVKRGIVILQAIEQGEDYQGPLQMMKESLEEARKHPKRIAGTILEPFAAYVLGKAAALQEG
jgi:hypothetical protein